MITREEGLKQITEAKWEKDEYGCLWLRGIQNQRGHPVTPWLMLRPVYCDRGHIQFCIDEGIETDGADCFPRYFFSFAEADLHVRTFLMWRLWKYHVNPHILEPV